MTNICGEFTGDNIDQRINNDNYPRIASVRTNKDIYPRIASSNTRSIYVAHGLKTGKLGDKSMGCVPNN